MLWVLVSAGGRGGGREGGIEAYQQVDISSFLETRSEKWKSDLNMILLQLWRYACEKIDRRRQNQFSR